MTPSISPRLTEMKPWKSFAVNVAAVIMEGGGGHCVSGVAAFAGLQTQFGHVCQAERVGRRHLLCQGGVNVPVGWF